MKIDILGSGTIKTPIQKNCAGFLINNDLLLDCGPGIWRAMALSGIRNSQIRYIALSHFHADHVSDLAPFLLERYLLSENESKNITIIGPTGLRNWMTSFSSLFGSWIQRIQIDIAEIKSDLELEKYKIKAKPTFHTDNSLCYRIEDFHGKSLCYSGDTDYHENVIKIAQNCDVGIIEASHTEETKIDGHLTPVLAAQIAETAKIKKLILTHFYPEVYGDSSLIRAAQIFKGEFLIAHDNMKLDF